jgi:hypothetical protein
MKAARVWGGGGFCRLHRESDDGCPSDIGWSRRTTRLSGGIRKQGIAGMIR